MRPTLRLLRKSQHRAPRGKWENGQHSSPPVHDVEVGHAKHEQNNGLSMALRQCGSYVLARELIPKIKITYARNVCLEVTQI